MSCLCNTGSGSGVGGGGYFQLESGSSPEKVSAMPHGSAPAGTELVPAVQSGTNVYLTVTQIRGGGSGSLPIYHAVNDQKIEIYSGNATGGSGNPGADFTFKSGVGDGAGRGGVINVRAGDGGSSGGDGGYFSMYAGYGKGGGRGGSMYFGAGDGSATGGNGGKITFYSGTSYGPGTHSGDVYFTASNGYAGHDGIVRFNAGSSVLAPLFSLYGRSGSYGGVKNDIILRSGAKNSSYGDLKLFSRGNIRAHCYAKSTGGYAQLYAGDAFSTSNTRGGNVIIKAGKGDGIGYGGAAYFQSGDGGTSAGSAAGYLFIRGGSCATGYGASTGFYAGNGVTGGNTIWRAGTSTGAIGGRCLVHGGVGSPGGPIYINAGAAAAASNTAGGYVTIKSGNGNGAGAGGNINFLMGTGATTGNFIVSFLPTSYTVSHGFYVNAVNHRVYWK